LKYGCTLKIVLNKIKDEGKNIMNSIVQSKSYPRKKIIFDMVLMCVSSVDDIDLRNKISAISQKNNDAPVLIKCNDKIYLYGIINNNNDNDITETISVIDNPNVFSKVQFPDTDETTLLESSEITNKMQDEITK